MLTMNLSIVCGLLCAVHASHSSMQAKVDDMGLTMFRGGPNMRGDMSRENADRVLKMVAWVYPILIFIIFCMLWTQLTGKALATVLGYWEDEDKKRYFETYGGNSEEDFKKFVEACMPTKTEAPTNSTATTTTTAQPTGQPTAVECTQILAVAEKERQMKFELDKVNIWVDGKQAEIQYMKNYVDKFNIWTDYEEATIFGTGYVPMIRAYLPAGIFVICFLLALFKWDLVAFNKLHWTFGLMYFFEGLHEFLTPDVPAGGDKVWDAYKEECYNENLFVIIMKPECHTMRDPHVFDVTLGIYMLLYIWHGCSHTDNCNCSNLPMTIMPVMLIEVVIKLFDMRHYTSDVFVCTILLMFFISSDLVEESLFKLNPALACLGMTCPSKSSTNYFGAMNHHQADWDFADYGSDTDYFTDFDSFADYGGDTEPCDDEPVEVEPCDEEDGLTATQDHSDSGSGSGSEPCDD